MKQTTTEETRMTYEEAIREAVKYFDDAVVMTGGYDEDLVDHLNDLEDEEEPMEVYVHKGETWVIRKTKADGYIDMGEVLAHIVPAEDYDAIRDEEAEGV